MQKYIIRISKDIVTKNGTYVDKKGLYCGKEDTGC